MVSELEIRFPAGDRFELGGILYAVEGQPPPTHAVVFNTGGGIPARWYRRFARFLAESGVPVLTYDYRGIGLSRPRSLRGFEASLEDWSEYDCAGAIASLRAHYPKATLVGVAHSVGNIMFGAAHNAHELAGYVLICPHTGYYGDYQSRHRLPMALLWHGVMPVLTMVWGYFPGRMLRLGEDIPKGVARQWAGRRSGELDAGRFASNRGRFELLFARCAKLTGRALFLSFGDDAFATDAGANRVMQLFPKLSSERRVIAPKDVGLPGIGHFGFFRETARLRLWPETLAWLVLVSSQRVVGLASAALRDEGNAPTSTTRISTEEPL